MEWWLGKRFGTTNRRTHSLTLPDALAALSSLCLLQCRIHEKKTVIKLPQTAPQSRADSGSTRCEPAGHVVRRLSFGQWENVAIAPGGYR
jgi:hypothetical protein